MGHISIHAPRVRGDLGQQPAGAQDVISIHAPRVRGDAVLRCSPWRAGYFNPRPSCEGRPVSRFIFSMVRKFQSTPLV